MPDPMIVLGCKHKRLWMGQQHSLFELQSHSHASCLFRPYSWSRFSLNLFRSSLINVIFIPAVRIQESAPGNGEMAFRQFEAVCVLFLKKYRTRILYIFCLKYPAPMLIPDCFIEIHVTSSQISPIIFYGRRCFSYKAGFCSSLHYQ